MAKVLVDPFRVEAPKSRSKRCPRPACIDVYSGQRNAPFGNWTTGVLGTVSHVWLAVDRWYLPIGTLPPRAGFGLPARLRLLAPPVMSEPCRRSHVAARA